MKETNLFEQQHQALMTQLVDGIRQTRVASEMAGQFQQSQPHPVNQRGAFSWEEFDLSGSTGPNITANSLERGVQGYKLIYLREGSAAGGRVDVEVGGQIRQMAPGNRIECFFDNVKFLRSSASVTTGFARFLIVTNPQADFHEPAAIDRTSAIETTSYAATANATNNTPSAATDGASLVMAKSVRVALSADSTRTLSGAGTLEFWYYHPSLSRWCWNPELSIDLSSITTATYRDVVFADRNVELPVGRVFVEARSVTVSAGALTVTLQTMG